MRAVTDFFFFSIVFFCSMKKKNIFLALASYFICGMLAAQAPLQVDMETILKKIVVIPPTLEEFHTAFTIQTKYGEKFGDSELLNPIYYEVKQLVVLLHDQAIRERMKNFRRPEMPDSIQYEEERWKLALRPPLSIELNSKLPNLDPVVKDKVCKIINMQQVFDWLIYYKEQFKIDKEFRQNEASISTESGREMAYKMLGFEESFFKKQQVLWMNRYNRYTQGIILLQELLQQIHYGTGLSAGEKKVVLPILADVQARALETIEKLVWSEFTLVIKAEQMYQGARIVKAGYP